MLFLQGAQNRLNGPHHKGKGDEDHGNSHPQRGEGHLDAKQVIDGFSQPSFLAVDSGQSQSSNRSRQCEGQVDQGIEESLPWESAADECPGDDQSEDPVEQAGNQRQSKADLVGGHGFRRCRDRPELSRADASRLQQHPAQWQEEHDGQVDPGDPPRPAGEAQFWQPFQTAEESGHSCGNQVWRNRTTARVLLQRKPGALTR